MDQEQANVLCQRESGQHHLLSGGPSRPGHTGILTPARCRSEVRPSRSECVARSCGRAAALGQCTCVMAGCRGWTGTRRKRSARQRLWPLGHAHGSSPVCACVTRYRDSGCARPAVGLGGWRQPSRTRPAARSGPKHRDRPWRRDHLAVKVFFGQSPKNASSKKIACIARVFKGLSALAARRSGAPSLQLRAPSRPASPEPQANLRGGRVARSAPCRAPPPSGGLNDHAPSRMDRAISSGPAGKWRWRCWPYRPSGSPVRLPHPLGA